MPNQRYPTEEIILRLRETDVLIGQGRTVAEAAKQIGITDNIYFRWRNNHGGNYLTNEIAFCPAKAV